MKKITISVICLILSVTAFSQSFWSSLYEYCRDSIYRVYFPHGKLEAIRENNTNASIALTNGTEISDIEYHSAKKDTLQILDIYGRETMVMKAVRDDKTGEIPFSSLIRPKKWKEAETRKETQAKDILKRIFGDDCKYLNKLNDDASAFSYGEQRLLSLARLLMGNDRLLLLDEPTSGVNPVYIDTIEKIIREMVTEGLTVLLIEHNMHFVRRVADICAYLDDGIIAKIGPTAEVLDDKNVRNSYLGL